MAIPFFSFVLVPLALAGTLLPAVAAPVAGAALALAEALHRIAWPCLRWVADLPGATLAVAAPPAWWLLAATLLAGWILPVPLRLRLVGALAMLPLLASASAAPARDTARLLLFDVSDGGAVLLRTRHHAWLLGTGAGPAGQGSAIDRHVLPWLRAQRIHRLDAVVISRPSRGEVAGVAQLLASLPVGVVWTGGDWRGAPDPVRACPWQRTQVLDGIRIELFAVAVSVGAAAYTPGACILRIRAGDHSVLWIGAATAVDLGALTAAPTSLGADLLLGGLRARRDAGAWAGAVRPQRIVSTAGRDAAARAALGRSYGIVSEHVHLTAVDGPLVIELAATGPVRIDAALDPLWVPRWRVPRVAAPVL